MRVAIRVDASSEIGTGHFTRCLSLADALKVRGARIRFVSRHLPAHLQEALAISGHEFVQLKPVVEEKLVPETAHAHWLGVSQQTDARDTLAALSDVAWGWLVVDHYALDTEWEARLQEVAKNTLVIDDIADRTHQCAMLLDQNLYLDMESRYRGKVLGHKQLLLGPRYALLRNEFKNARARVQPRSGRIRRVLVFFGGIDRTDYTTRAIEALAGIDGDLSVDVVIGAAHPRRRDVEGACADLMFKCHVQTDRMAELMATVDLGIGAGGSSSWERCSLGVPALLVSLAANQIEIARALEATGACRYLGPADTVNASDIRAAVLDLLNSPMQVRAISEKAFSLVDGLGVDRVCDAMGC